MISYLFNPCEASQIISMHNRIALHSPEFEFSNEKDQQNNQRLPAETPLNPTFTTTGFAL